MGNAPGRYGESRFRVGRAARGCSGDAGCPAGVEGVTEVLLLEVVRLLRERLAVVLVGVLVTGAAVGIAVQREGVYQSTVTVLLLGPVHNVRAGTGADAGGNAYGALSNSLTMMAGVLARSLPGQTSMAGVTSPAVSLADTGVQRGWTVRQPNYGGQWATDFRGPQLDVIAVGRTPVESAAEMDAALAQLRRRLDELQDDQGVPALGAIRMVLSPDRPQLRHVAGSRARALGLTTLLGGLVTACLVVGVDRRVNRLKASLRVTTTQL